MTGDKEPVETDRYIHILYIGKMSGSGERQVSRWVGPSGDGGWRDQGYCRSGGRAGLRGHNDCKLTNSPEEDNEVQVSLNSKSVVL